MAGSVVRRLPGHEAGVREWARWVEAGPEPMDWRDRLYLEQRIAGWLSSAVQGVDITGRCEVHLANNTAFISGMLAMPASERVGGAHQRAIDPAPGAGAGQVPGQPEARQATEAAMAVRWLRRPGVGHQRPADHGPLGIPVARSLQDSPRSRVRGPLR